jgi:hypothetical protein
MCFLLERLLVDSFSHPALSSHTNISGASNDEVVPCLTFLVGIGETFDFF